jgi:hypothetical protein
LRNKLPQEHPAVAAVINAIEWQGVQEQLPGGSVERAVVEGWLLSGLPLFWIGGQRREGAPGGDVKRREERVGRTGGMEKNEEQEMMIARGEMARGARRGRGDGVRRATS